MLISASYAHDCPFLSCAIYTITNTKMGTRNVKVHDENILTINNSKLQGLTCDKQLSLTPHTTACATNVQSGNKILKSFDGSKD